MFVQQSAVELEHVFGLGAVFFYALTLLSSHLKIISPQGSKFLLTKRRASGLTAFSFAGIQVYLVLTNSRENIFSIDVILHDISGIAAWSILALLAATSNNWSVKKLRANWKKLPSLTYVAWFILTFHVGDKMAQRWTIFTPFCWLALLTNALLFILRKISEFSPQKDLLKYNKYYIFFNKASPKKFNK